MEIEQAILQDRLRKIISISALSNQSYCLVGNGAYAYQVLKTLYAAQATLPTFWLVSELQTDQLSKEYQNIIQLVDDNTSQLPTEIALLGTGQFQLEMMERLSARCKSNTQFFDLMLTSPVSNSWALRSTEVTSVKYPDSTPYIVYLDIYADTNTEAYLSHFFDAIQRRDISIFIHHPLESLSDIFLKNAQSILVWNGSTTSFGPILQRCQALGIEVTFMECGFFPQHRYFYLDKHGVNALSQLHNDDLSWVGERELRQLDTVRTQYTSKYDTSNVNPQEDFILVPLQVPTDSNVLNHSRFKHGMQEFIDYIEQLYPNETVLFKVHPKDRLVKDYRFSHGEIVVGDVFDLIAKAKLVHGINSSVLYEAALMGKPVVAEGDCLLKCHADKIDKLLAAMISRQHDVLADEIEIHKLQRFSYLQLPTVFTKKNSSPANLQNDESLKKAVIHQ